MADYNSIINFLNEYIKHYKELLSFENAKLNLVMSGKVSELNDSLSKEQALVMKGNSLESKRVALMEKEGLGGLSLSEIINKAPQQYKTQLTEKKEQLSKYIFEIKRINESSMNSVNEKLDTINKRLRNTDINTYDEHAHKQHIPKFSSSISKNI